MIGSNYLLITTIKANVAAYTITKVTLADKNREVFYW